MNLMQLNLRTASVSGLAQAKVRVTGPVDPDGCVEVTCVEIITVNGQQKVVFSDEVLEGE